MSKTLFNVMNAQICKKLHKANQSGVGTEVFVGAAVWVAVGAACAGLHAEARRINIPVRMEIK
jgi:hypothetical protein